MDSPPTLQINVDAPPSADSPSSAQRARHASLTPSLRRERPPLRSSPLAGPSYAADKAGHVVQQSSALDEEIARRKSQLLLGLNDEELARLATLSPSPSVLSLETAPPAPSRQGSTDSTESGLQVPTQRRARPSFISLSPASPTHHTHLPPPEPSLRTRHSSPNIARSASLDTAPLHIPPAEKSHWMTDAPAPSFSRNAVRGSGVILPVKADSKTGKRMRRKSLPGPGRKPTTPTKPLPVPVKPCAEAQNHADAQVQSQPDSVRSKKSTRSLRSLSRMFHHEKEAGAVPPVPALPYARSRGSSTSSVQMPLTPPADDVFTSVGAGASKLSLEGVEKEEGGRVKRLWAKVFSGVKKRTV